MEKKSKKQPNKAIHLIIDGSDKTGKTTVCYLLSKKLNMPVIKMQNMPHYLTRADPELASEVYNRTLLEFKDFDFIMDRGYPSSLVYSSYFKRTYDLTYLAKIERDLNPIIIILVTDNPRADDDVWSQNDLKLINTCYKSMAIKHGWYVINATNLTPGQTCQKILDIAKK